MPNNTNITHLPTDETLAAGLAGIANALGATVDTAMSDSSTNAVQNKVIKAYVDANACAPFIVTVNFNGTSIVADKTFGEIKAAADSNKLVFVKTNIPNVVSATTLMIDITETNGFIYCTYWDGGSSSIKQLSGTENEYPTINSQ